MNPQIDLFGDPIETATKEPVIEGMTYVADFLSPLEQDEVLRETDLQPWRSDLKRRVQHYGYRYDYKARRVDRGMYLGRLPSFAMAAAGRLVERSLFSRLPDQLIVNEYLPGQGITAHIDCEPCFADTIAMVSLSWAYEMEFIHAETDKIRRLLLAPGSVLVIAGDARYKWLHQIKARKSDRGVARRRRVSLTFRNVLLGDSEQPRETSAAGLGVVSSTFEVATAHMSLPPTIPHAPMDRPLTSAEQIRRT